MINRRIIFLIMVLFGCIGLWAQQTKTVSGIVSDASTGETLIGASVVETGTNNGITTDLDGKFNLQITGKQITVSYVGYQMQTVNIPSSGVVNVRLQSDLLLDEIVVVGYGTQRKSDLTGQFHP